MQNPLTRWLLPNRHKGEVAAKINGQKRILRLSLYALAYLEACYDNKDIQQILTGFTENGIGAGDVQNILSAALLGGENSDTIPPNEIEIDGGFTAGLEIVTQLLERAFIGDADITG